jgi:uncharacterized protein YegP (UPF0339 family)
VTNDKEATMNRFEAFRDMHDKWRWRLIGADGRVTASSAETFDSQVHAARAAEAVKAEAAVAAVSPTAGIGPKEVIAELIRREDARRLKVATDRNRGPRRQRNSGTRRSRMGSSPARIRTVGSRRTA